MQQLNSVTLRGVVGTVRVSNVADTRIVRMSVATSFAYRNRTDSSLILETTWHNVLGFEKSLKMDLDQLSKGDKVEIQGRIRNQKFTDENDVDRTVTEILASRITRLELDDNLQYEA